MRRAWFLSALVGSAGAWLAFVAGGIAAAAGPLAYSHLSLGEQGGAASAVGTQWHSVGPRFCAVRSTVTFTGSASLSPGSGGIAVLTLHLAANARNSAVLSGEVTAAGSSELELSLRGASLNGEDTATVRGDGSTFSGSAVVWGKPGCAFASTVVLTLAGSGLTASTSTPTGAGRTQLGGVNVDGYCLTNDHQSSDLAKGGVDGTDFAFDNWRCGPNGATLDMQALCEATYSSEATNVIAVATDPNSAYSWQCYGTLSSATSTTTTTTLGPTGSHASGSHRDGAVAPIAASLGTPGQVFHSIGHDLLIAAVTVGVMLFIAFPANIFNQTLQDHYEEVLAMARSARRRVRGAVGLRERRAEVREGASSTRISGASTRGWFLATLLIGAVLGGLLNPAFGANASTVENLCATLFAFAFGAVVSYFVARAFRRHHRYEHHTYLKALPLGLAVAAACVLVSRLTDFSPGYLYGVVVGIAFVETISDRHNAHLTALSALSTLAVAVAAWLVWIPVNHLALEPGSSPILDVLDDTLGSIFVAGLVGTVVNMLPLRGLPGGTLAGWRRDAWAGVCFLALFLLIEVELAPASGPSHPGGAPIATAIVLFVLFGALSLGFRTYFERRGRAAAPAETVTGPAEALAE